MTEPTSSRNPRNSQPGSQPGTPAGSQSGTPAGSKSGSLSGEQTRNPASRQVGSRPGTQPRPKNSGAPDAGTKNAGRKQKSKQPAASRTSKEHSDWNVFRTIVIAVGLVVAAFGTYYLVTGTAGLPNAPEGPVNPTLESQYRFFAAMMIGIGAAFITIAVKFEWANMLWLVCLMIFIGGIGRVLSWAFSGTPHYTMIILMVIELAFPAALLVWHAYITKTSEMRRQYSAQERQPNQD